MQTRLQKSLESCGICYQKVLKQGSLNVCGHIFCLSCINSWAQIQNTCPLCKRRFTSITEKQRRVNYGMNSKRIRTKTRKITPKNQEQNRLLFRLGEFPLNLFNIFEEDFILWNFLEFQLNQLDRDIGNIEDQVELEQ